MHNLPLASVAAADAPESVSAVARIPAGCEHNAVTEAFLAARIGSLLLALVYATIFQTSLATC